MADQQLQAPSPPAHIPAAAKPEHVVEHTIVMVERGPFVVARCAGCGWETFARRSRPLARREGSDHVLLHRPVANG
jgi:hypothetical protein